MLYMTVLTNFIINGGTPSPRSFKCWPAGTDRCGTDRWCRHQPGRVDSQVQQGGNAASTKDPVLLAPGTRHMTSSL